MPEYDYGKSATRKNDEYSYKIWRKHNFIYYNIVKDDIIIASKIISFSDLSILESLTCKDGSEKAIARQLKKANKDAKLAVKNLKQYGE